MDNGSRFGVRGPTGRANYLEGGDYHEHHHYQGDAPPSRTPLPEMVASLASWIDRSHQVQEIQSYFRKRYALVKRNNPVLFLLPSRSGDYGDLFIQRCAREIVPRLVEDGQTVNQELAQLYWRSGLDEPGDLLLEFAEAQDLTGCRCADDVVFRLGAVPANHYLAVVIDGRTDDRIAADKVQGAVAFLADRLPEIARPSRLFVFLHMVCTDDYAGSGLWGRLRLRRCRVRDVVGRLTKAYDGHERVVSLPPLDLVGYADYERWVEDLSRWRHDQLYHPDLRDGWTKVFRKTDERLPLGEIHAKLREILEEAYHKAAQAA